ncbi:HNH endonuclease, partial [Neisseria dentiae]|nr:HNH endonuclease [Neisseria dentiae]
MEVVNFLADFIPVIGDIKGFAEAETKGDYFFAALGVVPLYGDSAKKIHQAQKTYEAAKAAKDVGKMKAAMNEARKGADLPYDSRRIRVDLERRYGAENVRSTTVSKNPVQSANSQNKPDYTSTVYANKSGRSVNVKYRDPVSGKAKAVNIAYDSRGLPIFDNVSKFTSKLDTSLSYTGQMRAATRDLWKAIESGKVSRSQFT